MNKHFKYMKYIIKHKWYVMIECFKYGLIWQGFIHDWTKLLPIEWFPYTIRFYGKQEDQDSNYPAYKNSWNHHVKYNKHHWEWWVIPKTDGRNEALPISSKYRREMVADWIGTGISITGDRNDIIQWYTRERDKIIMHEDTRKWVESEIQRRFDYRTS